MKVYLSMPAVALLGIVSAVSNSMPLLAEEILVDAVGFSKWEAECDRCTQVDGNGEPDDEGQHVEISVEPGDIIVFRQAHFIRHGIGEADMEDPAKIRKRGDDEKDTQIVVELGDGDTKFGKILPGVTGDPVEMTRIEVRDNFRGSLKLWCTQHKQGMTVTLNDD